MDELTYNGRQFSEFNTFFDGSKAFGTPEKDYELVEIMGRNGNLSIYNDRFKDITLPFPCFCSISEAIASILRMAEVVWHSSDMYGFKANFSKESSIFN